MGIFQSKQNEPTLSLIETNVDSTFSNKILSSKMTEQLSDNLISDNLIKDSSNVCILLKDDIPIGFFVEYNEAEKFISDVIMKERNKFLLQHHNSFVEKIEYENYMEYRLYSINLNSFFRYNRLEHSFGILFCNNLINIQNDEKDNSIDAGENITENSSEENAEIEDKDLELNSEQDIENLYYEHVKNE